MKRAVSKMVVPVEHTDWWKDVMTSTLSVTVWRDCKNGEMRRLADLGFHASLRVQGQGIIVTQATCPASLWLSSPACFQFMFPTFSWYPCLHFLQPIRFNDESAQFLGGAGRRKDLCYIRKSYSRQGGTHPAVSLKGHHSVNLARPSWRRLAINFDLPANVRLFCTLGHKVWLTFYLRWLPVKASASPGTHSGSQGECWTEKKPSRIPSSV